MKNLRACYQYNIGIWGVLQIPFFFMPNRPEKKNTALKKASPAEPSGSICFSKTQLILTRLASPAIWFKLGCRRSRPQELLHCMEHPRSTEDTGWACKTQPMGTSLFPAGQQNLGLASFATWFKSDCRRSQPGICLVILKYIWIFGGIVFGFPMKTRIHLECWNFQVDFQHLQT